MPSDQHGLFDVGAPAQKTGPSTEPEITEAQVQRLREAFAAAGISSMDDRKAIIESCALREVTTIRDLYAKDVRPILRRIEQRKNYTGPATGSAWDNREEDTWIDRL